MILQKIDTVIQVARTFLQKMKKKNHKELKHLSFNFFYQQTFQFDVKCHRGVTFTYTFLKNSNV